MAEISTESWFWLASGLSWGAVNSGEVLAAYPGGADEIFAELGSSKLDELLTQKQAERLGATRPQDFALQVHGAQSSGLVLLSMQNEAYPHALRNIHNPPLLLFVQGDTGLLNGQLAVGMVGARRPSAYGVEAAKALGRGIALGGAIIVSGLAAGLDAEAHKAALAVNGPTVACIAFGHNHCYPAANKKLMEIIGRYGAVISEYPPDLSPEKAFFLQRNRLIAGLSHGLVVIEARRHSGTMSTVNFAADFGREVFAVPGSIFSELSGGTNAMIQEGAYVAASAGDVLNVYGVELKGEDPVATAARQAMDGRPEPATAAPPWQQSLRRFERSRETPREVEVPLPGQQSLGELLRKQLGESSGEVSAAQAVNAFRALQQKMPAATDSELDARNRALDEMVEAVSDSVQISPKARKAVQKQPSPAPEGAQPFPWHRVERLDKSEVEDLSPATGAKKRARRSSSSAPSPATSVQHAPPVQEQGVSSASAAAEVLRQLSIKNAETPASAGEPVPPSGASASPASMAPPAAVVPAAEEDDVSLASTLPPAAFLRQLGKKAAGALTKASPLAATPPAVEGGPVSSQRAAQKAAVAPPGPIQPVGRVGTVPRVAPASGAAAVDAAALANAAESSPAMPRIPKQPSPRPTVQEVLPKGEFVPMPVAQRPVEPPRADSALTGRLRTLQNVAPEKQKPLKTERAIPRADGFASSPVASAASKASAPPSLSGVTVPSLPAGQEALSGNAQKALAQLRPQPATLADICQRSGLSSAQAMAALTELELAGLSRQLPGRQFVAV